MFPLVDLDKDLKMFSFKMLKQAGKIAEDDLENFLNETTEKWLAYKNPLLGGKTPDEFFENAEPNELTEFFIACCDKKIEIAEPLYRKISQTSECAEAIYAISVDMGKSDFARSNALTLLCDMDAQRAKDACVMNALNGGECENIAVEFIKNSDAETAKRLLKAYDDADEAKKATIIEIVANFPQISETVDLLRERLINDRKRTAFYASCAANIGDASLLDVLKKLADSDDTGYYDYSEVANAIVALGGVADMEKTFYGDSDYEALINYTEPDDEVN